MALKQMYEHKTDYVGALKWYDQKLGYGFIQPDSGKKDIFIHKNHLDSMDENSLVAGLRLRFRVVETSPGKPCATHIRKEA